MPPPVKWMLLIVFAALLNASEGRICSSRHIRNSVTYLMSLRNCTTIQGSLSIAFVGNKDDDFTNYTFPKLREITGYLLLYTLPGLKSLRHLFPNLTVIRGQELMGHHALVIFELPDLTEIGLVSLVKIEKGFVLIRRCPRLCYAHTIDWDKMTQVPIEGTLANYVDPDRYDSCPTKRSCPSKCPKKNCWNHKECQLFDERSKIGQYNCDSECLGECTNPTASGCKVCRNYYSLPDDMCVPECPLNQFISGTLCVNKTYCENEGRDAVMGECREKCPEIIKRMENWIQQDCDRHICPGIEVDSIATSNMLRGCMYIRGSLHIRIKSAVPDTMQILERNLGEIEAIEGILKVHRSPAITSLAFLKNLQEIQGESEKNETANPFTLIIWQNDNLQKLWDFEEKPSMKLARGALSIHHNNKLCLKHIRDLQRVLKTNTSADLIGNESNGFDQTCSVREIFASPNVLNASSVEIVWKKINITEEETIAGYLVYYIKAPQKNITHIGFESCVSYGWQTNFIQNFTKIEDYHSITLHDLDQNTQYAYYVKTQVVYKDQENNSMGPGQGQSNIRYFKTKPAAPNYPVVHTVSKTNTTLHLAWYPILDNDLIEQYRVDVFIARDNHQDLDMRNYCTDPRIDKHVSHAVQLPTSQSATYQSCNAEYETWQIHHPDSVDPEYEWRLHREAVCREQASRLKGDQRQMQIMKYVENHDLNMCSIGQPCISSGDFDSYRFSRQIDSILSSPETRTKIDPDANVDLGPDHIRTLVYNGHEQNGTIYNLLPYTKYIFQHFACNYVGCSPYTLHYDRTEPTENADSVVLNITKDDGDNDKLHLNFSEPSTPNGLIVAYYIEKHDVDKNNITNICITRKQHAENGERFTVTNLGTGRYIFRVRAVSLAMVGPYSNEVIENIVSKDYLPWSTKKLAVIITILTILCLGGGLVCYIKKLWHGRIRDRASSEENIIIEAEVIAGSPEDEDANGL